MNIAALSIAQTKNEKIEIFCKVWGFLKYYHPLIASGNINWDSVFVKKIDKVINTKTNDDFNEALMGMVNAAGKVKATTFL